MLFRSGNSTDLEEIAGANTYWFLTKAFEDIATHPTVKNVVIDLSCNGGGVIQQCMLALCFLRDTNDFFLAEKNHLDNSVAKFYYSIDTGSATSLKKNYNFYVLTSGYSFSCGNFFPAICHYQLGVPIVGQKKRRRRRRCKANANFRRSLVPNVSVGGNVRD